MVFFTSIQDFFVPNSQLKKFKSPMSPEPFGDRNDEMNAPFHNPQTRTQSLIIP